MIESIIEVDEEDDDVGDDWDEVFGVEFNKSLFDTFYRLKEKSFKISILF